MKDAGQHAGLAGIDLTAGPRVGDKPLELVGGASLRLGVGIGAERAKHAARGRVEDEDEGVEDDAEELEAARNPACKYLGVLDRVQLGDDLAGDALRGC